MFKYKINILVFVFFLVLGWGGVSFAQNYPIQITTQLAPPFSGFIPDYSTPGNQNLKLLVVFTDFTKPTYNIKLKLQITGQGITIQSKSYYYSGPITLQPGTPIEISGSDLSGLLNSTNLDFNGINAQQYQTNSLPEGYYNICFTAYDFNNLTPIQVSNQSCAFGWMVLSDPPFLNLPFCESTVNVHSPQNMMFQWTPMNMNSPNSANSTLYDFDLYEVRPGSQSPGNIIQTLPPIYQATTPFTFLNYGITEPQLYYGMQYVWRVRARDQSGRDLFKNQGYSQLCTFTYCSVLSQIDTNSLKLTLQGTALTYRLAKYTWDSLSIFLSYKLEYRKQGSPNWFPINTTTCKSIVNNLEPENTYEARVKGIFSEGDGPWSNVVTITTPAKPLIVCGQGGIPPLASNFIPLKTGNIAQVWNIGQFDMVVTQLDNPNSPNGKYSGYGVIGIPFLMNMPLIGKFSNITVNEAMEVVEGKVEITTTGIDAWLQQWQPPPGWNETDNLHYNGSISNVTSDTGTIFVNGQAFGNTGGNTLITDDNGNIYYVSADGSISTPEGPLEAPVSDTITSIPDSLPNIMFTDGSTAQFAFDSKEISSQTAGKNYDMLQKGSETYSVACKLLQTGAQDNLTATLGISAQEINTNSLVFKRSDGTIVPSTHIGNTYQLTVKGKLNLFADALWAFAKKKNSTDTTMYAVGKINLISVDKKKKKIVIIPVNSIGINTDAASLQTQINAIYKKVAVEWEVTKAADLQVPGYTSDSLLNVTRSALNITYGADLRKIINAYKAVNLSIDENTAYLFLVNKASNNDLGYMALNKKFGFIFLNNNSDIAHTIAHELGHGKLVLQHTFTGETGGATQNLLDYNNGTLFNHLQFKAIHDPDLLQNLLAGLVQDEDAGALSFFDLEKWLIEKFGISCYNTYKNYDGIIPQCAWNNSAQNGTPDNGYGCAMICGILDGAYVTVKDIYNIVDFVSCFSLMSFNTEACIETKKNTAVTLNTLKQIVEKPNGYKEILKEVDKVIGNWAGETFCTDRTCAYNQGRLIFDVVSLFYGAAEAKALLKTGVAGNKIAKMMVEFDKTALAITKALRASVLKAQKVAIGFQLAVQLNTGVFFNVGKLEAATKAIRLNVTPLVATALPNARVITKFDDVAYIIQENGASVVKHGSIDIVDNGATALPRVSYLPSIIRQLLSKPSYKPFRTIVSNYKTSTFIGKWDEIIQGQQNGLQKVFNELSGNDLNIYMQSGKFDHPGGFNMLSIEDWNTRVAMEAAQRGISPNTKAFDDFIWDTYNKPWLESAMQRGDDIIIWSDPFSQSSIQKYFQNENIFGKSFYGRELEFIQNNASSYGYNYSSGISLGTFSK